MIIVHNSGLTGDSTNTKVEIDRRMLDFCVGLDTEFSEIVEGSHLYFPQTKFEQVNITHTYIHTHTHSYSHTVEYCIGYRTPSLGHVYICRTGQRNDFVFCVEIHKIQNSTHAQSYPQ